MLKHLGRHVLKRSVVWDSNSQNPTVKLPMLRGHHSPTLFLLQEIMPLRFAISNSYLSAGSQVEAKG